VVAPGAAAAAAVSVVAAAAGAIKPSVERLNPNCKSGGFRLLLKSAFFYGHG